MRECGKRPRGVISINVGPKRVHITAFCPDDELGLLACDFVLRKIEQLLDGVSEDELRQWLIEQDDEYEELFKRIDAGWTLPKRHPLTIDPLNAAAELRIVSHLIEEQRTQEKMRTT